MSIIIYTDGSGKGNYVALIQKEDGSYFPYQGSTKGITHNEAEYKAVLLALSILPKGTEAIIHSDSMLVVNQLSFKWNIKSKKMRKLAQQAHWLVSVGNLKVTYKWVPREENLAGKFLG